MNRLVRTELLKQRTTPSIVLGVVAAPVIGVLVAIANLSTAGEMDNPPLDADSFVGIVGASASIVTLIAVLIGIIGMAGEHRHRTITTTYLATPRRARVLAAKVVAHALTGALLAVACIATSVAVAVPWLHGEGVPATVDGRVLSVAAGVVIATALYGALGVAVGALVPNLTAAVAVVLVWLLAVEGIVEQVLGDAAFVDWLPAAVARDVFQRGTDGIAPPVAALAFTAYVTVAALAASRLTIPKDIS